MATAQQPPAPREHSSTLHKLKPSHIVDSITQTLRPHKNDNTHVADADDPYAISSGKAAERHARHRHDRQERDERMEREKQTIADKRAREDREAAQHEPPELRERYGDLIYPQTLLELDEIASMAEACDFEEHQEITFRARIHHHRNMGPALVFILFRRGIHTLQGVVHREATSEHMIDWTKRLPPESIVQVTGHVETPREAVREASISNIEICVQAIHLASQAHDLPFNVSNKPDALHTRLESRIVDLRDPANQAIFRIRARVMRVWRECLDEQGFIEINTPKLQPAATESGAEVFKVRYFGRTAFLAQSPQLAKQMAISADLRKVYEIGPVFRAENSNTHRHLTEYTGLDLEMSIERDYHEAMWILVRTLLKMFAALYAVQTEVDLVQAKWPSDRLALPEQAEGVPIIPFAQGIQMLRDDGQDTPFEDLSTRDEMRLGELVKDKYGYDFFVLDKFPKSARPFYTMPDTGNQAAPEPTTNSFDMFVRGQEICTGGQRIHDPDHLRREMKQSGIDEHSMQEYLEAFDWGVPPHAGAGLGLERILTFGMQLGNVRNASLFHRDPKSLPERQDALPHPESSTLLEHDKPPALEELIANYGDASNTAWLDDRFQVWRHERTGAAVGWVHKSGDKFVFTTGDPLCDSSQLAEVTTAFIEYAQKEIGAKPCWLLCSTEMQDILGKRFDFRTLSCAAEQRVDEERRGNSDDIGSATRRTAKQGIECEEAQMTDDLRSKVDERIEQWKATRSSKGGQVHMTEIAPWRDMDHRRYFTATNHDGQIDALVVLCRLAPRHGWQVKWALDFPNANSGSIEALIALALSSVGDQPVTFGAGVTEDLVPGHALGSVRAKFLDKTYKAIAKSLSLGGKASFREKFGIRREEVWVCFPKRSLITPGDAQEIVDFFKE